MFEYIRQDLQRCGNNPRQRFRELIFNPGMWAVLAYRYRRWLYVARVPPPVRWAMKFFARLMEVWILVATNIEISIAADVGPGLYIAHSGYIVIGSQVRIGSHCTLTQGVTIGHAGGGRRPSSAGPLIGHRVYIGPGAAIVGSIEIGDDALIGVGAIVVKSIPSRGVAVGNPSRLISRRGSFDLISYPGMEIDPKRLAALAELASEHRDNTATSSSLTADELAGAEPL